MCGIVGYIGKRDVAPLLLEGLQRLEYRGYDSAGIVVTSPKTAGLRMVKAKGRVRDLEAKVPKRFAGTTGIAHTRWATHGAPSDVNAHPHLAADRARSPSSTTASSTTPPTCAGSWRRTASSSSPRPTPRCSPTSSRAPSRRSWRTRSARPCGSSRGPTASPCCTPTSPTASWWRATAPPSCSASARRRCSSPRTSPRWSPTPGRSSRSTTARWPRSRPTTSAPTPPRAPGPRPSRPRWSGRPPPTTWAATTRTCTRRSTSRPRPWTGCCAAGSTTASRPSTSAA